LSDEFVAPLTITEDHNCCLVGTSPRPNTVPTRFAETRAMA
jgi:hypothetical protein